MTYWSFEVPIKHLEFFEEDQDFNFTLSILYKDPEYLKYYMYQVAHRIKCVWLDNSVNETNQPDSCGDLCLLANEIFPDCIISPDGVGWDTKQITEAMHKMMIEAPIDSRIYGVFSSWEMFQYLKELNCGLAVSYEHRHKFTDEQMHEIVRHQTHFLGLVSIHEIKTFKPLSCDTSMPIKLALQGMSIQDWIIRGCPHIHTRDLGLNGMDFFKAKLTPTELKLAKKNIHDLKELTR